MFRTIKLRRALPTLLVLVVLGLSAQPASALFENTAINPAGRAMGETGVATGDGAYAAMTNPAQLAGFQGGELATSYVQPFGYDFNDFYYLGSAFALEPRWGHLGLAVSSFGVDSDGTSLLTETRLTLAHAVPLFSDLHSTIDFGYALNLYRAEFGETTSGLDPGEDTAFGLDLGMMVTLHGRTRLGFQINNLNNPDIGLDNEELGRRLIAGIAYEPYDGVTTTFEFDNELGQDLQYHGGLEFRVVEGFQLRAGLVTNPNKLTGGFGYSFEDFSLDYGFSSGGGTLEYTHQFGLKFAWGGEAQ